MQYVYMNYGYPYQYNSVIDRTVLYGMEYGGLNINPVTVYTKELRYKKDYIEVDLRIPVFQGPMFQPAVNRMNTAIESDIREFNRQMEEAAKEYVEGPMLEGRDVIPYRISNVYRVTYNRNNIISIVLTYYEFVGGRDYYIKVSYNYNLLTGRPLSLSDLFRENIDYKKLIDEAIRSEVRRNPEAYFPGTIERFQGITVGQPFYIENERIVIFFGFHQMAPTEAGIPVIALPFTLFGNALRTELLVR